MDYWRIVARFAEFFTYLFAVPLLVRTLFLPWKRDIVPPGNQALDLNEWFKRHLFNVFSRIFGLVIKLFTLLFWFVEEIVWWGLSIILFPLWLFSPLVIFGVLLNISISIPIFLNHNQPDINFWAIAIGAITIIVLVGIEIVTFKAFRLGRMLDINSQNPRPNELWFISLCVHLLVDIETLRESWMKDGLKELLVPAHLGRSEFDRITSWEIARQVTYIKEKCWWLRENLFKKRPLTEDWVFGWTFTLNNFSRDLYFNYKDSLAKINTKELEILKNSLAETDGVNIVIVGEPGTGRSRLVKNLALDLSQRNVPARIIGKKILDFQLDNLLAASSAEEDKIYLLEKALLEACSAGNIIIFIPTLRQYLDTETQKRQKGQIGKIDISSILTNFLENTGIQIITCASQQEVGVLFQSYPSLTKYFKIIQLQEPDLEDCLLLLCEKAVQLENKYGKLITYGALKKSLEISNRYFQEVAMPKKALDFLEEAISYVNDKNPEDHVIKDSDIEIFASDKLGSPIGSLKNSEKEQLVNLEEKMMGKIVGQTEAIKAVAGALRRKRLDISSPERPAGCFLFLGPTGVGKTYTAEVLAELYYGGEDRIARLDMSEYQGIEGINKLLGDASGEIEGYFRKILAANPFNLILLDELEKASREIHQLLLQIMEEGMAKTGTGKKLNFRETIIIATSNAEALLVQELVKKNEAYETTQKTVIDRIQRDRIFSPELLNRFDEIVVFHPLGQDELYRVAELALKNLRKRLLNKEIVMDYNEAFAKKLAETTYDPVFGARELRRVVEKQIEDAIAKDLLAGNIIRGRKFSLPLNYLK